MRQWEQDMADFVPDKLLKFDLLGKKDELLFEEVGEGETAVIRGMYLVGDKKDINSLIDFYVLAPNKRVIHTMRQRAEGLFIINATLPGQYTFIISNLRVSSSSVQSFSLK
jgi:emp24/gp25L/p24 family/GOLD